MLDLESAIKHCEEVEETQRGDFKTCPLSSSECDGLTHCKVLKHGLNKGCLKCATEHRQLAEWLRKLKAYEDAREEIERKMNSGQWSDAVIYGMNKALYIQKKHLGEVNADEDRGE